MYWTIGKMYFRPEVFREQKYGDVCPFRASNNQLMRNFLFVATGLTAPAAKNFGLIVICPRRRRSLLVTQLELFRKNILLPMYHQHISLVYYDDYLDLLAGADDAKVASVGKFLIDRMSAETGIERSQTGLFRV